METKAVGRPWVFIKPSCLCRLQLGQELAHCDPAMADFIDV
jgi:hypothetical protein